MLVILPTDDSHYRSFINLNCVERCWVGEEYVQENGDMSYKPFFLMLGEAMIGFDSSAEAEQVLADIVDAYEQGKKVFRINKEETKMLGQIEVQILTDLTTAPQHVASAMAAIENSELVGASYKPIMYCGQQVVRGINYCFIAEQTLVTATPERHVVKIVVNEFNGKYEIVKDSIARIF